MISHHLEEAENKPQQISTSLLKVFAKKLELHYKEFTEVHREILAATVSSDNEAEGEVLNEFDALHTNTLILLEQLTESLSPASNNKQPVSSPNIIVQQPIRAPVPTFDGKVENWPKFRTMFEDIFARSGDSDAVKLHHLDKALKDDAAGWITAKMVLDNNFQQTWQQLIDQYENPRVIVDTHIDGLLDLKPMTKRNQKDLLELVKTFNRHVGGLEYQGLEVDELSDLILTKILTSRLDDQTLQLWERNQQHATLPNLKDTVAFLRSECQILERFQNRYQATPKQTQIKPFVSSKQSNQKSYTTAESCLLCKENHRHFECPELHKLSPDQRYEKVKNLKICFNCLRPGHRTLDCSSKKTCSRCQRKHHTLLHQEPSYTEEQLFDYKLQEQHHSRSVTTDEPHEFEPITNTVVSCSCHRGARTVMLMTAIVQLKDNRGRTTPCRVLLDSGSQVNFIHKDLVGRLFVTRRPARVPIAGIGGAETFAKEKVMVQIKSTHSNFGTDVECLVVPTITEAIPATKINVSSWPIDRNLPLADPNFNHPGAIDMLIGVSQFFRLLKAGRLQLGDNLPELLETHLGWVVAGDIDLSNIQQCFVETEVISAVPTVPKREKLLQPMINIDDTRRYVVTQPSRVSFQDNENNRNPTIRRFLPPEINLQKKTDHCKSSCYAQGYLSIKYISETTNDIPDDEKPQHKLTTVHIVPAIKKRHTPIFTKPQKPSQLVRKSLSSRGPDKLLGATSIRIRDSVCRQLNSTKFVHPIDGNTINSSVNFLPARREYVRARFDEVEELRYSVFTRYIVTSLNKT
ncbi:uncharacterized protein LOC129774754 [Toxorhynchites rutilus septentrionalis]|uniref:uncharacterized protein LOC129774754 n=1 Tax=Toxorhynchites rutilus septentrionalis TaxID=329112 RepID=UPI002478E7C8|nr:uncharacterized protein LOC129774754 [Toxorhynchites rutilus septentrionalis]